VDTVTPNVLMRTERVRVHVRWVFADETKTVLGRRASVSTSGRERPVASGSAALRAVRNSHPDAAIGSRSMAVVSTHSQGCRPRRLPGPARSAPSELFAERFERPALRPLARVLSDPARAAMFPTSLYRCSVLMCNCVRQDGGVGPGGL